MIRCGWMCECVFVCLIVKCRWYCCDRREDIGNFIGLLCVFLGIFLVWGFLGWKGCESWCYC